MLLLPFQFFQAWGLDRIKNINSIQWWPLCAATVTTWGHKQRSFIPIVHFCVSPYEAVHYWFPETPQCGCVHCPRQLMWGRCILAQEWPSGASVRQEGAAGGPHRSPAARVATRRQTKWQRNQFASVFIFKCGVKNRKQKRRERKMMWWKQIEKQELIGVITAVSLIFLNHFLDISVNPWKELTRVFNTHKTLLLSNPQKAMIKH